MTRGESGSPQERLDVKEGFYRMWEVPTLIRDLTPHLSA